MQTRGAVQAVQVVHMMKTARTVKTARRLDAAGAVPGPGLRPDPARAQRSLPPARLTLADLPLGAHATVLAVCAGDTGADALLLRRLGELGFVAGEPVQLLHRGPGGREPLAVQIGETLFALRLREARCIQVETAGGARP